VNERAVTLSYSADAPVREQDPLAALFGDKKTRPAGKPETRSFRIRRTIRREDLRNAREYVQSFWEDAPETFPGTTALGVSAAVLTDLKTKGESQLTIFDRRGAAGALGNLLGGPLGVRPSNRGDDHIPSCCAPTMSVAAVGDGLGVPCPIGPGTRIDLFLTWRGDTA